MKFYLLFLFVCADAFACKPLNHPTWENNISYWPLKAKYIAVISTREIKANFYSIEGIIQKKWGGGNAIKIPMNGFCRLSVYPGSNYLFLSYLNRKQLDQTDTNYTNSVVYKLETLSELEKDLLSQLLVPEEILTGQVNQFWSFCDKDNDCIKTSNKCAVNSKFKDRYEKYISTKGHSKECPVNDLNDNPIVKCEDNFCK